MGAGQNALRRDQKKRQRNRNREAEDPPL
jgi:hypothetical protein